MSLGSSSHRRGFFLFILFLEATSAFAPFRNNCNSRRIICSTIENVEDTVSVTTTSRMWTESELLDFASEQGVMISFSTLGPGYRAVARAKHDSTLILGYVEGVLRPGVLHLDKMEVFRKQVLKARAENPDEFKQGGTIYGVGLLMGYLCLLYAREKGYRVGEFLAIDDEEKQHQRLVRYYERSGFKVIKYVGDDFRDIPDRLVWGGCGTLMRQDIDTLLQSWTTLLRKSQRTTAMSS